MRHEYTNYFSKCKNKNSLCIYRICGNAMPVILR